jgi:hypothetical protein
MKNAPLVISILALFVALSGTSYAAVKLNGKNIKKGSVPATALKKNSLGGKQINESKLGKVPSAVKADTAGSAISAATLAGIAPESLVKGNASVISRNTTVPDSASATLLTVPGLLRFGGTCNDANQLSIVPIAEVDDVLLLLTVDRPGQPPLTTGGSFDKDHAVSLSPFSSQKFHISAWRRSDPSVATEISGGAIQCNLGAVAIGHG